MLILSLFDIQEQSMISEMQDQRQIVLINKQREIEYDQRISKECRDRRIKFYQQQIPSYLKNAKVERSMIEKILESFLMSQYLQLTNKYEEQLHFLIQSRFELQQEIKKTQRNYLPLMMEIRQNVYNLKAIRIQYKLNFDDFGYYQCRYSISAFQLFKVIHNNRELVEVTLKGVLVEGCRRFIQIINPSNQHVYSQRQKQQIGWMKQFNPSKSLKLTIDTRLQLGIYNKDYFPGLQDLIFIRGIFTEINDITVNMIINWSQIKQYGQIMHNLWRCLRSIKNIKIQIKGENFINGQLVSDVRSYFFGGLASLTEISHLSFEKIQFTNEADIKDIMAIQQMLSTIFENNLITYLKIHDCFRFPLLPQMPDLQIMNLNQVSFRRKLNFMSKVNSQQLKSIHCLSLQDNFWIDEQLFDRLEVLLIPNFSRFAFSDTQENFTSNLKYLKICSYQMENIDYLWVIFAKLVCLTHLFLQNISIGHQLICAIPSPHLQYLHISKNFSILDEGIQEFDVKWPQLRDINIDYCCNITERIFSACEFKGLMNLKVGKSIVKDVKVIKELLSRGIRIDIC